MENQESAATILAERDALRVEVTGLYDTISDLREDVLYVNERCQELREDRDAWRHMCLLVSQPLVQVSLAGEAERSGRGSNHSSPASSAGEAG